MTYTACYCPNLDSEKTKSGFLDKQSAEEYIATFACKGCKHDLEQGFDEIEYEGEIIQFERNNILQTSCGAEWLVVTDDDWESFQKENLDFEFLLGAAGYEKKEKE